MPDETATLTATTTSPTDGGPTDGAAPVAAAPAASAAVAASAAPAAGETSVLGGAVAGDGQAADAAPADGTPAAPEAGALTLPEKYELALDGMEIDTALAAEADPVFRALNLNNDQANTLLPVAQKIMQSTQDRVIQSMIDAGANQRKEWLDAFAADPDIGGGKREETEHLAGRGLDALGFSADHPFRKALTETGFGNHPDMIRTFRRLGELVGEDGSFERSNAGAKHEAPVWERMYPNESKGA